MTSPVEDCEDCDKYEVCEDNYSGLPFEEGRFGGEAAERAQVQIARVTAPGITMKCGGGYHDYEYIYNIKLRESQRLVVAALD